MHDDDIIDDMIDMSRFVYAFQTLRQVVRDNHGKIHKKPCFLGCGEETKIMFDEPGLVVTTIDNKDKDKSAAPTGRQMKHAVSPADIENFMSKNRKFLKDVGGNMVFDEELIEDKEEFPFESIVKEQMGDDLEVVDYDDQFTHGSGGLVYGAIVNHTHERITVIFRGTVGKKDFLVDRDFTLNYKAMFETEAHSSVPGGKPGTHNGFTSYLFSTREIDTVKRPYIDRIVNCVEQVFATNPTVVGKGYKLYVTGHSLGGALSNMFAFRMAQLKSMGHPSVKSCPDRTWAFTFASPCVGNHDYNKEFQLLEKNGFLRHFRFSNEGDIVPTNEFPLPFEWAIKGNSKDFTQNGYNLHLKPADTLDSTYRTTHGFETQFSMASGGIHSILEYDRRLELDCNDGVLHNIKLDEMYDQCGDYNE